jgi:plasmid stabilization system protein ParE
MARRVRKDPNIEHDIKEIYTFIAKDDPSAAQSVIEAIADTLEEIAEFPEIGPPTTLKIKGGQIIRRRLVCRYRSYSIYYSSTESELHFLYVHHRSRDEASEWKSKTKTSL